MKKRNHLWVLCIFLVLCSCFSVPEINYSEVIDDQKAAGKNRVMIQLYDDVYKDKFSIKTDVNISVFEQNKIDTIINTYLVDHSRVLEFVLDDKARYIIVKYNTKKYKLKINKEYTILFIGVRNNNLDVLYSNREPIFTDY